MICLRSNRGSVLVVTLIFAAVVAIALTSYMEVSVNALKLSQRSFCSNGAMNLVDTGFEQALWSQNSGNWTGFAARSGYAGQWQGTFPSATDYYRFKQGVKGQVKVWIDTGAATPHGVARATITMGDGTTLSKVAEIYVKRRSFFANGLVARNTITFSGNNAMVDSWNSDPDDNPATPAIPYSAGVAHDNGSVASTSVQVDSISVSNADIYGFVAVGGTSLSDISVGPNGLVGPYGTANGTIDTSRVTYDFTTNFQDESAPSTTGYMLSAIAGALTLPRVGDVAAADGSYYYTVPSISLSGNNSTLSIGGTNANVVITVTNVTGTTVSATGQGGISIAVGSSLALYTGGDVAIAGNGVANGTLASPNQPAAFQLYGTRPASAVASSGDQNISITGNGILSGVVYAPNGSLTMKGGGTNGIILGSMVGDTIAVTGNSTFHYDESLANLSSSNLWAVSKWRELTSAADRSATDAELNF